MPQNGPHFPRYPIINPKIPQGLTDTKTGLADPLNKGRSLAEINFSEPQNPLAKTVPILFVITENLGTKTSKFV